MEEQLKRFLRYRIGDWDPVRYLACSDATHKTAFTEGTNSQCLPQANLEYMCDNRGNCSSLLRCHGSKGGKCFNGEDVFVGRIDSRMAVMDVKEGVDGAFSMANVLTDQWLAWDSDNNGMKTCKMTNDTIMNAKLRADGTVSAYYKEKFKQECTENTNSDGTDTTTSTDVAAGTTATGMEGRGGAGDQNQNRSTENIPETDLLLKLILEKCPNDVCT